MAKFTNITTGDRGLYTVDGLVMVPAGQTVDVELAKDEVPVEEWFAKGDVKAKAEPKGDVKAEAAAE